MQIYPAIDIKDGKCVRLLQGDFKKITVFDNNPSNPAKKWLDSGATFLHIVDLDGAKQGSAYNNKAISDIIKTVNLPVQVGGGIRTIDDIEKKLDIGVNRVIIGTAAIQDKDFVKSAIEQYGDKIAIGIDAKDGFVATHAWETISKVRAIDLCLQMENIGVKTIIYTDISKDGMMQGPNIEMTKKIIDNVGVNVIASGGVSNMNDLENIQNINASGVIIGKALYQGAINLKEAINLYERLL